MSHQTGIEASEDLRDFFASAKNEQLRLIKVDIRNEKLELAESKPAQGSWEDDYDALILPCLKEKQPCYILYRFDQHTDLGYTWLFIAFSPDNSPVRQKMLYAATRATLKKEFGGGQIKEELFGTTQEDVKLTGFKLHLTAQHAPAPLTMAEEELEHIKKHEVRTAGVDSKAQTLPGLAFPVDQEAVQCLEQLRDGALNYVQLSLDLQNERVNLVKHDTCDVASLVRHVPTDGARYHFYKFVHTFEGDQLHSIVFIYSMPGYKCSIKERMLYSSCKGPVLDFVEQNLEIEVAKKFELDDPSEISEQFLYDGIHPKKDIVKQQFARPKGPAGRGPKRMTKT